MYSFDEIALIGELKALPQRARKAFAAAAATRQLGNFERFARESGIGNERRPREIADQLWIALQADAIDGASWSTNLDEVMSLLPEEGDDSAINHALADDALSSLAYAIRCLLSPEPQEAAWAGRRAYEAADQAAIRALDVQPGSASNEAAIKSHGFVQRELSRQTNDLSLLRDGSIAEVQQQALVDELLTEQEAASLS